VTKNRRRFGQLKSILEFGSYGHLWHWPCENLFGVKSPFFCQSL